MYQQRLSNANFQTAFHAGANKTPAHGQKFICKISKNTKRAWLYVCPYRVKMLSRRHIFEGMLAGENIEIRLLQYI